MKVKRGLRIGMALGGGAARGLAHLGVLSYLEQEEIPLHALAGVSVGSIIAAGYAAGLSVQQLLEAAKSVNWKQLGSWSFSVKGFNRNDRMTQWLADALPAEHFEDLQIPLRIVATDLHTGQPVIFESGDLATAIRASCAIPGLYVPVEVDGRLLADGYLSCNLPIRQVKEMGVDVVLASAIGLEVSPSVKLNNIYQILMRSFSILSATAQQVRSDEADVVFRPRVENYSWADIEAASELFALGEEDAEEKRAELHDALNPSLLKRIKWNPWRRKEAGA